MFDCVSGLVEFHECCYEFWFDRPDEIISQAWINCASDLQVFSRIGKAIKKLQWIPNTIMNISVIEYLDNVYIYDSIKTALSTHGLGNI